MLDNLIENLKKELDIADLVSSEEPGHFTLNFEENLQINISQVEAGYLLFCAVAPCPKKNTEMYYNLIMEANLFGQATLGAVLGLNEEGSTLTLSRELDYNINSKEFMDTLEDFVNVADFWRKKTSEF